MVRPALLGYALLGLLAGKPRSGYELRKLFVGTPMRHFSDSPGSVYPALRGLHDDGYVRVVNERGANPRGRRRYAATRAGLTALRTWLLSPVEQDDIDRPQAFLLRFSFMDGRIARGEIVARLKEFGDRMRAYAVELQRAERSLAPDLSTCGMLALQNGVRSHRAQADWAEHALAHFERLKGDPA